MRQFLAAVSFAVLTKSTASTWALRGLQTNSATNSTVDLEILVTVCVTDAVITVSPAIGDLLTLLDQVAGLPYDMHTRWLQQSQCENGATRIYPRVPCPIETAELQPSYLGFSPDPTKSAGGNVLDRMLALFDMEIQSPTARQALAAVRLDWASERLGYQAQNAIGYNLTLDMLFLDGAMIPLAHQAGQLAVVSPDSAETKTPAELLTIGLGVVGCAAFVVICGMYFSLRQQGGFMSLVGGSRFDKFIKSPATAAPNGRPATPGRGSQKNLRRQATGLVSPPPRPATVASPSRPGSMASARSPGAAPGTPMATLPGISKSMSASSSSALSNPSMRNLAALASPSMKNLGASMAGFSPISITVKSAPTAAVVEAPPTPPPVARPLTSHGGYQKGPMSAQRAKSSAGSRVLPVSPGTAPAGGSRSPMGRPASQGLISMGSSRNLKAMGTSQRL